MSKRRKRKRPVRRRHGARMPRTKGAPPADGALDRSPEKESDGGLDEILELLGDYPFSRRDGLSRLLLGLAAAELSMARLINAENEKAENLAKRIHTPLSPEELIEYEKSLAAVMAELVKKEELLLKKLRLVLAYAYEDERFCECGADDEKWDDGCEDECDEDD